MHIQHKRLVTWAWIIILGMRLIPVAANPQAIDRSSSLIREMVSVPDILEIRIAPDGKSVALVREAPDWENDYYDNEIVLVDADGERYLTRRSDGGSWRPRWQAKSSRIAYLQFRADSGTQLYFHASTDSDPIEDERVPIAQAQMFYRGLRSIGTPAEFVIFPGLTHYFSKPKARFAAAEQNRRWFGHYLFGEPAPNVELTDTTVISSVP